MEAARTLLTCLDCPYASSVNFNSRGDVILLVTWLEDRKIRELEIDQREKLRKDHEGWDAAFGEYLMALGCPYLWNPLSSSSGYVDSLTWLISHSITAEYEDLSEECANQEAVLGNEGCAGDEMQQDEAASGYILEESNQVIELRAEVDNLAKLVALERKSDESDPELLQRISRQVRLLLTEGSMKSLMAQGSEGTPLQDFPLGFDTQDAVVNQIALVLRMLYLFDFRELQNDLNALIVLGQEYTANPKTNSGLGKVGR
jgi:hypothetical protein